MPGSIKEIEILSISDCDTWIKDSFLPVSNENLFYLVYCTGAGFCVFNGIQHPLRRGTTLLFPSDTKYCFNNDLKTISLCLKIYSSELTWFCQRLPFVCESDLKIGGMLDDLIANKHTMPFMYEKYCELIVMQILIKLIQGSENAESLSEQDADNFSLDRNLTPLVSRIVEYIKIHYREQVDSCALEQNFYYSYRHLSSVFLKETGMTPKKFIEWYRIYKSKEYLMNNKEIKYISDLLNYSDVHQFTRTFRKFVGIPPAKWRSMQAV